MDSELNCVRDPHRYGILKSIAKSDKHIGKTHREGEKSDVKFLEEGKKLQFKTENEELDREFGSGSDEEVGDSSDSDESEVVPLHADLSDLQSTYEKLLRTIELCPQMEQLLRTYKTLTEVFELVQTDKFPVQSAAARKEPSRAERVSKPNKTESPGSPKLATQRITPPKRAHVATQMGLSAAAAGKKAVAGTGTGTEKLPVRRGGNPVADPRWQRLQRALTPLFDWPRFTRARTEPAIRVGSRADGSPESRGSASRSPNASPNSHSRPATTKPTRN